MGVTEGMHLWGRGNGRKVTAGTRALQIQAKLQNVLVSASLLLEPSSSGSAQAHNPQRKQTKGRGSARRKGRTEAAVSYQRCGLHVQKVWTNVTDESQRVSQALFHPLGLQGVLCSSSPAPDASSSPEGT